MCGKLNYFISFVLVLGLIPAREAKSADPSLVGWWKFEESSGPLHDESDYHNDGTANGVVYQQSGQDGYALGFDGINDTVVVGANGRPSDTFTFGGWFKTSSTHEIDGESTGGVGGTAGQRYAFDPAHGGDLNGGAGLSVGTNGISVYEHGSGYMPSTAVYAAEIGTDWNHIMVVYDNKQPTIYLNGELAHTGLSSPRAMVIAPVQLGGMAYGYFEGLMDEVHIYDRVLTPAEIGSLAAVLWATKPDPADGAAVPPVVFGSNVYLMLDYTPGPNTITHTAYFSDVEDDVISRDEAHCLGSVPPWPVLDEEAFVVGYDDLAIEEFARAPLVFGKTYYWCVDEFDGTQPWPGEVWSFLVLGEKAWGPSPANGEIFVAVDPELTLSWNLGDLNMKGYLSKITYKVYLGTDETDLPLLVDSVEPNSYVVPGTNLDPDTTYYWRVDEIRRENSVPFPAVATEGDVWSFRTAPPGVGRILREWWYNLSNSDLITDLVNHPRYPDDPTGSELVTSFEGPTDIADSYGSRIHGWLYIQTSGDYTFWIATDNQGQLWLSSDEDPANATMISDVSGGNNHAPSRAFDDPDVHPSAPIYLEGGKSYYISGIMKEGAGGDNIAVAWRGPDSGGVREVIPGNHLKGYVPLHAHKPTPADGAIDVALNAMLSWTPGTEETTGAPYTIQHVYVGSDATAVAIATTGSDEYMGVVGPNQYGPLSLSYYEQVYWRVDSEDSGTGTIYPSPVWTFKAIYNPSSLVDPHLLAWYKLDGDPCDSSGYGRAGTEYGGPIYSAGYDGQAINFDGLDDYVIVEVPVGISGNDPRTIAGWAKAETTAIADWANVFGFCPAWEGGFQYFDIEKIGGESQYCIHIHGYQWSIQEVDLEWHHFAVTYDTVVGNAYVDGEWLVGIETGGYALSTVDNVRMGYRPSQNAYFPGSIDDFRIYDYALDAAQIATVMRINLAWAYNPNPDNGATGVARTPILTWTGGDYATSHYVFFGTDEDALPQVAGPQPTTSYNPGILDLGTTYYWAIGEANAAAPPDYMDRGRTWKFTTVNYVVIDNMDVYVPYDVPAGPHIFVAWRDGKGDCAGSGNETGANLLETTPALFATSQLMQYDWDNDGFVLNPCTGTADDPRPYYYSKIEAQVAGLPSGIGSNWTMGGVKALSLLFYGDTLNSINDPLWVELSDSSGPGIKVEYGTYAGESLGDIQDPAWHEWLIDLNDFDVQLTNVVSIAIGVGDENATSAHISSGTLYIDDVRLYTPRCIPPRNTSGFADADYAPVGAPDCVVDYKELKIMGQDWAQFDYNVYQTAPDPAGLVASYQFENNVNDGSPNGNHGTAQGSPIYSVSRPGLGMALECDGVDDYVSTGKSAADLGIEGNNPRTVTAWVFIRAFNGGAIFDVGNRSNGEDFSLRTMATDNDWRIQYWGSNMLLNDFDFTYPALNEWVHFGHVHDGTYTKIYANGELIVDIPRTINTGNANPFQVARYGWPELHLDALIDDFRLYDYGLSHGEVRSVAGMPTLYVPVSSPANISDDEPATERKVNFLDYAELMDFWGMEQEWPSW